MCGRYGYYPGEFRDIRIPYRDFIDPFPTFSQRFNIAPTQDAPVIVPSEAGNVLKMLRWGLIPNWSKNAAVGHINARAETIAEKPTFKPLFGTRHCLVLTNGFYEWRKDGKQRFPLHFKLVRCKFYFPESLGHMEKAGRHDAAAASRCSPRPRMNWSGRCTTACQ